MLTRKPQESPWHRAPPGAEQHRATDRQTSGSGRDPRDRQGASYRRDRAPSTAKSVRRAPVMPPVLKFNALTCQGSRSARVVCARPRARNGPRQARWT